MTLVLNPLPEVKLTPQEVIAGMVDDCISRNLDVKPVLIGTLTHFHNHNVGYCNAWADYVDNHPPALDEILARPLPGQIDYIVNSWGYHYLKFELESLLTQH